MPKSICLVYPPLSESERNSHFSIAFGMAVPLGLCHLAAVVRDMDWKVSVIDCRQGSSGDPAEWVDRLAETEADIYGFSAITNSIGETLELIHAIKRKTGKTILLGGPHVSAVPVETLMHCQDIDVGVVGEGEETVKELLPAIENGLPLADIAGIVYRDNGQVQTTPRRTFIKRLDDLPYPAWDLLPDIGKHYHPSLFNYKRLPSTHLVTSRGCPANCAFCDNAVFGRSYREFSAEYVLGMISHLYEHYGIRDFLFDDDNFLLNKRRVKKICDGMSLLPFQISWAVNARIDTVNEDTLSLMARHHCWQISYGVESGSQKILDDMNKRLNLDKVRSVLACTKRVGIRSKAFFIVGYPTETKETLQETMKFVLENPIDELQCSIFTPYPNTKAAQLIREPVNWTTVNMFKAHFNYGHLTAAEINAFHRKILMKFYGRLSIVGRVLKDCVNPVMVRKYFIALRLFLKLAFDVKRDSKPGNIKSLPGDSVASR